MTIAGLGVLFCLTSILQWMAGRSCDFQDLCFQVSFHRIEVSVYQSPATTENECYYFVNNKNTGGWK